APRPHRGVADDRPAAAAHARDAGGPALRGVRAAPPPGAGADGGRGMSAEPMTPRAGAAPGAPADPRPARRPSALQRRFAALWPPVVLAAIIVALWEQIVVAFDISELTLAKPSAIVNEIGEMSSLLFDATWI